MILGTVPLPAENLRQPKKSLAICLCSSYDAGDGITRLRWFLFLLTTALCLLSAGLLFPEDSPIIQNSAQAFADEGDAFIDEGKWPEAAEAYQQAEAMGEPYTTKRGIFFEGKLYENLMQKGDFRSEKNEFRFHSAYLIARNTESGAVTERYYLPGTVDAFELDDTRLKIEYSFYSKTEPSPIYFAQGEFDRPVFYGNNLLTRMNSMRNGQHLIWNFGADLVDRKYVPGAHFDSHPEKLIERLPKTLEELETALIEAIELDSTEPWYLFYLGQTYWSMNSKEKAEKTWKQMFEGEYPATPYFMYSWMASYYERLGQPVWADRAYEKALALRKAMPQPIAWCTLIEKLINTPFVRSAAWAAKEGVDLERQYLWVQRSRELAGICVADEFSATAWAVYFQEQEDSKRADYERTWAARSLHHPWNIMQMAAKADFLIFGILVSGFPLVICWLLIGGRALFRARQMKVTSPSWARHLPWGISLVAFFWVAFFLIEIAMTTPIPFIDVFMLSLMTAGMAMVVMYFIVHRFGFRALVQSISPSHRRVFLFAMLPLLFCMTVSFSVLNQFDAVSRGPMGMMDSFGHAHLVNNFETLLESQGNMPDARYLVATAQHAAGNVERAKELYESLPENPAARENLVFLQDGRGVGIYPNAEQIHDAYVAKSMTHWLKEIREPSEEIDSLWNYLLISIALCALAALLFGVFPYKAEDDSGTADRPLGLFSKLWMSLLPGGWDLMRGSAAMGYLLVLLFSAIFHAVSFALLFVIPKSTVGVLTSLVVPNLLDSVPMPPATVIRYGEGFNLEAFQIWLGAPEGMGILVALSVLLLVLHLMRLPKIWRS